MIVAGLVLSAMLGMGCNDKQPPPATPQPVAQQPFESAATGVTPNPMPADALHVDANRAWTYNKEIVGFGTRPVNSEGHKKLE